MSWHFSGVSGPGLLGLGLAALLAGPAWACDPPEAPAGVVSGPASPASGPASPASGPPAAPSSVAHPGEIEMVAPDGSVSRRKVGEVPESIAWGTDADGRRTPVARIVRTDGVRREILRYSADGALLDVTVALPPLRPPGKPPGPAPKAP